VDDYRGICSADSDSYFPCLDYSLHYIQIEKEEATMRFKKGDKVRVYAEVTALYLTKDNFTEDLRYIASQGWLISYSPKPCKSSDAVKYLFRRSLYKAGLVIGYTRKATGNFYAPRYHEADEYPSYLAQDKRHLVVVVEPLDSEQWKEPWFCLEEDLR